MKRFLLIWCVFISVNVFGQNRTNIWELSYPIVPGSKTCELKLINGTMDTQSIYRQMYFFVTNASICDTSGELLFYSNGLTIENRNYDTLQNAVGFNPGSATDSYEPGGMGTCQGVLILPDPGNEKRYYIFHVSGESFIAYDTYQLQPLHLNYSVVDMNLDGGMGGVVDSLKNKTAITDTLMWGGLTAVKHANGRDWWIVAHRFYNDKYYKILLTPNGLEEITNQLIGSQMMYDVGVQATFSSDGSKYCLSTHGGWLDYLQFDRCSGEFSDAITIHGLDTLGVWGSSFSPNGRFLYASSQVNLYQYDTWNPEMVENAVHIAAWDSFVDPIYHIPIWFFMHQLAADNKIYLSTWGGSLYFNVINSPDSLGLSCNFQPHSYILPDNAYNVSLPSFPNYDLGTLDGSPCDTIIDVPTGIHNTTIYHFRIVPNPVHDWLNIIYESNDDLLLELFDINGKLMTVASLYHYFKNRLLNVSELPPGVYVVAVSCKGERVWSEKVVVQR